MLAPYYLEIRALHITCAVLSITLYAVRGLWLLRASPLQRSLLARVVPHVNDTLLLAAGIALAIVLGQYPGTHAWLTAKLAGLLVHIGLGFIAFRGHVPRRVRVLAFIGSVLAFGYVVAVALTRAPLPLP